MKVYIRFYPLVVSVDTIYHQYCKQYYQNYKMVVHALI